MRTFSIALLGFGNVGQALARLLLKKRETLNQQYEIDWRAVGIATRRHGMPVASGGLDLEAALGISAGGGNLAELSADESPADMAEFLHVCGAHVVFENTPVDYESGQPARDHLRLALELGMHAITANKGPVVHGFRELSALAHAKGKRFLFEATVMDGAPVFSTWREALPAARLLGFRGVLNSTTNLVLGQMEQGASFEEAVARAQAIGVAETDPSGDIDGWDAAVKVAALVTVLMEYPLKPNQVDRQGIGGFKADAVRRAGEQGRRWKLVCQAVRSSEGVQARVAPEMVPPEDPLHHLDGTTSAVTLQTDVLGDLTLTEANPGPQTTAYGLLADFLRAVGAVG